MRTLTQREKACVYFALEESFTVQQEEMKKSEYAHVPNSVTEIFVTQADRQISKGEKMKSKCVGCGNISVVSIYNASFLLWSLWAAVT